ncbi:MULTISPECIES: NUMOD3 domain-containing DNA-binding protein [unclassified Mycolicibacterium]|uniref:NUMOD3 domain-containing DNA-binding protein n=1 Tax=unclassified Mycolicibacterium TaxID=2636767 RepID=UPI00130A3221|nr:MULTISPECIES: NUMOD3 domain-containing DNA-binding protein [unclassified Mycolicibacterium]MUL80717.1 NUMOD3 motif protein [Mycolicibacterium sp. CBMA 329]MUL86484.1 NUMOD3 motif protein [Mycolicibacterium sp. CBMA 331]MUM01346.1 NUMOD3 motif protein [Mycolicibacterium sp. CBMA 334]MUM25856.1 NUMOD3 motif protein [Mycolicibacterium sp. CBMA 295]MUM36780.1 NUMOD3 motif protein [Mycolicibacterium sp. CBMA 247]
MRAELPTEGLIYGVRLRSESHYRYVGLTTKTAQVRLRQHLRVAAAGTKTPFYDWLRKQDRDNVIVEHLDWADELDELGEAEIAWIALLRQEGHPLLNLAGGGLGPTGVEWTAEMREAARIRSTGRRVPSRFGEENPFYQREHSAEQRAKWSVARKGTNVGADNPNYGKFGADHPSFGHVMSQGAKAKLSEKMKGAGNPNFGRSASEETRAKMSAVRKGRPMPSSRRSAHTRHHTNRGVFKDTCQHCRDDKAARQLLRPTDSGGDD